MSEKQIKILASVIVMLMALNLMMVSSQTYLLFKALGGSLEIKLNDVSNNGTSNNNNVVNNNDSNNSNSNSAIKDVPDRFNYLTLTEDDYTKVVSSDVNYKNYKIFIFGIQTCPWCKRTIVQSLKMFGNSNIYWYDDMVNGSFQHAKTVLSYAGTSTDSIAFPTIVLTDSKFNVVSVFIGYKPQNEYDNMIKNYEKTKIALYDGKELTQEQSKKISDYVKSITKNSK